MQARQEDKRTKTTYDIGEQNEESFVKLLRLYIDAGYNFTTHLKNMKSSVFFKISCIKKISSYLSDANLRIMVESMVLSKISYCGEIYIGKTMEVQKQVQRLINPAARVLLRYKGKDQDYATAAMMRDWWNSTCFWVKLLVHNLRRCMQGQGTFRTFMAIQAGHKDHWVRSCSVKIAWGKKLNRQARKSFVVMAAPSTRMSRVSTTVSTEATTWTHPNYTILCEIATVLPGTKVLFWRPPTLFLMSIHEYHEANGTTCCMEMPPGDRQCGCDYSSAWPSAGQYRATHDYTSSQPCIPFLESAPAGAQPLRSL